MVRVLKPKPYGGGRLTEAAFWAFIRSGLRAKWQRWWVRYDVLKAARRKSQSANKRLQWEFQCASCRNWFAQADIAVDHVVPCGQLKSWADLAPFTKRLFCEADGLQILCDPCHESKTKEDKQ